MASLFDPIEIGPLRLNNRIALAPMTRERCGVDGVPLAIHASYYARRASAGLLVTGNNRVSANAACSSHGAGLHTEEQAAGYRLVTDAVRAKGGLIVAQLFHAGAGGHPDSVPGAGHPVGPSAVSWGGDVRIGTGRAPCLIPRPLEIREIADIAGQFAHSARLAMAAGFDGVEVHAASGYLFEQFFCSRTNRRTDRYGGSIANRCRILFEMFEAVAGVVPKERIGIKLSAGFDKFDTVVDDTPQETWSYMVRTLSDLKPAYLQVADNSRVIDYHALLRPLFRGIYIANTAFTPQRADRYIREGKADLISFGRLFIANPDLPDRIRSNARLTPVDPKTVYVGMLDYPTLEETQATST